MSDPEKDKNSPEAQAEDIVDAVVIEDEDTPDRDAPEKHPEPEAQQEEEPPVDAPAEEINLEEPAEPTEAPAQEPVSPTEVKKVGFVPLVLGGIVAAGIGFGASKFVFPDGWPGAGSNAAVEALTAQLQQQNKTLTSLETRLKAAENAPIPQPDLTPATDEIARVAGTVSALEQQLNALDTRLTMLEKQPAEGGANAAAVEAYEREVRALRDAMEQQKAEVDALVAAAEEDKASAEMTAQQAMIRSAVSRIQIALDTGAGFADAVSDLQNAGVSVPAALETAKSGVATMAQLSLEFPQSARTALTAARKEEGTGGNLWNFMRNQLGVRSLEPKEGTDADAILSRAEAAMADGRLTDALAELQALPEQARVELTDWMAAATQRAQALSAAEALSAQVASN
ncbi:COG4223 family protein [Thalassobius sp. S69A]|uniref:COG4223 family protein n=1 Tax=unclassified Thalassovita TaxID=2619711 RepID=UPI000C64928B|nr:hypothetical protein [Paracoccaceae bacterium]